MAATSEKIANKYEKNRKVFNKCRPMSLDARRAGIFDRIDENLVEIDKVGVVTQFLLTHTKLTMMTSRGSCIHNAVA